MRELYDSLIEGVDRERRVDCACCGGWRAWVESQGRAGVSSLLSPGGVALPPSGELVKYRGKSLRDMAALVKGDDPRECALGVAALNAYYNDEERLRTGPARLFSAGGEEGDAFLQLLPEARGKRVAAVGHFSGVDQLYAPVCDFFVFEREPREGDLPEAAEEELLPTMDLVFITGMALTNKTLPHLLQLAAGCRVVLTGPSLPLTDVLFDFGVNILSGLTVPGGRQGRTAAISQQFSQLYKCSRKVLWEKT